MEQFQKVDICVDVVKDKEGRKKGAEKSIWRNNSPNFQNWVHNLNSKIL